MAHTPGPWVVQDRIGDEAGHAIIASNKPQFITMPSRGMVAWSHAFAPMQDAELAEAKANAHMIAAAPDLLAALKACVATADFGLEDGDAYPPWLDQAIAAVARAEGR